MINPEVNLPVKSDIFKLFGVIIILYVFTLFLTLILKPEFVFYILLSFPFIPIFLFILINKTDLALLLYVAAMPILQHFSLIHAAIGSFLITPDMVIHIILLVAILNRFVFSYDPDSKRKLNSLDKLLLLFVFLSIFSLIYASAYSTDQGKRILLYYTGIFQTVTFYFFIIYFLNEDSSFLNKLFIALLFIPFSSAAVAFLELKDVGFNLLNIFVLRNQIGFGFHNTNLFGLETALLFPIIFFLLSYDKFQKYKVLTYISLVILTALSALTLNRGTFIVIVVFLTIFAFKKENRKIVLVYIIVGAIGALIFSNLIIIYVNRFMGGNSKGSITLDQSALYRIELWRVGIEAIMNYPLGLGGNGFDFAWKKYGIEPTRFWSSPHQIFLHIGIDYGLPALVVFLAMYYRYFKVSQKLSRLEHNNFTNLFFYVCVALLGYLIHGFLTGGELSHLSGAILPTNGYTYLLMILFAIISYCYSRYSYIFDNSASNKTT